MLENCTHHHLDPPFLTIKSDCGTIDRDLRIELICDEETNDGGEVEGQRHEPINRHENGNQSSSLVSLLQQPQPRRPIYPSHFQTNGAAYIFDPNSSLFYDSAANFYYDPKSDTYYDCTALKYYFYNNIINPEQPFIECSGDYGANAAAGGYGSTSIAATTSTNSKPKKISISISSKKKIGSTKSIPTSNKNKHSKLSSSSSSKRIRTDPSLDPDASLLEPLARKHEIDNMEKWTKLGKELDPGGKPPDDITAASSLPIPPATASSASASVSNSSSVAKCLLCKRKFPSLEALKKHEDKSPLHLENLRKAKEKEEEGSGTIYRDRNKERVEIFGDISGANSEKGGFGEKTEKKGGREFNTNMKEQSPPSL